MSDNKLMKHIFIFKSYRLIFQQHNDGIFDKKFKILIWHKLIGWNYNTWAAWVFVHPGHDVIIFIETADIYIFADVIENGMELVGQKEIQEYIQNHIQLVRL